MAKKNEISIRCTECGKPFTTDSYALVNVGTDPELKDKVRDGSLFVRECPYCGARNLVRSQTVYHDPEGKLMVWLLPEGAIPESSVSALEAALVADGAALEGYELRRVGDVGSLIEKVNIREAGLEDTVVEMCKYVTRMELSEKDPAHEAELMDAPLKFYRMEGADNTLIFSYPMEGKMHGVSVGFNVYEDCRGILGRNPSVKAPGGFARIDAEWIGRFFR